MLVTSKGKAKTTKELIDASIGVLIDALESGHSEEQYVAAAPLDDYVLLWPGRSPRPTEIVEIEVEIGRHGAVPLEPRALLADPDPATGGLSIFGMTKVPVFNRDLLASLLGMDETRSTCTRWTRAAGSVRGGSSTRRTSWSRGWPGRCGGR